MSHEEIEMSGDFARPNRVFSAHRRHNFGFYPHPGGNLEGHANKIVAKLEEDKSLMEDSPVSEQLRK